MSLNRKRNVSQIVKGTTARLLCATAAYVLAMYFRWYTISVLTHNAVLDPTCSGATTERNSL
jgi:hypothetical protein